MGIDRTGRCSVMRWFGRWAPNQGEYMPTRMVVHDKYIPGWFDQILTKTASDMGIFNMAGEVTIFLMKNEHDREQ